MERKQEGADLKLGLRGDEFQMVWGGLFYTLGTPDKKLRRPPLHLPLLCVILSTFLQQPVFSLTSLFRCLERLRRGATGRRKDTATGSRSKAGGGESGALK